MLSLLYSKDIYLKYQHSEKILNTSMEENLSELNYPLLKRMPTVAILLLMECFMILWKIKCMIMWVEKKTFKKV